MGRWVPHDGSVTRGQERREPGAPGRGACLRTDRKGGRRRQPSRGGVGVEDIRRSDATFADMYDPDLMPPGPCRVHQALDLAVDGLYRRRRSRSERERIRHVLTLYEKKRAPLEAGVSRRRGAGSASRWTDTCYWRRK